MACLCTPRLQLCFRIIFWAALAISIGLLISPHPPQVFAQAGDKVAHMTGFAGLAALGTLGFGHARRWRVAERLSFVGALTEVIQAIPALHRTCDITDWLADTSGIIVATAVTGVVLSRAALKAAALR